MAETASWSARGPLAVGVLTTAILVGGFGAWSALSTISGAVVASGKVEVERNRQVVQHPDGGVVHSIHVVEGQTVTAGDVLVELDPSILRSELAIVEAQWYESLARQSRLEAERDGRDAIAWSAPLNALQGSDIVQGQARLFEARKVTLATRLSQLEKRRGQIANQIDGIDAQIQALERQADLIDAELTSVQRLLDQGLAQASRVLSLQREEAQLAGSIGSLTASRAQAEGSITELEIQALGLRNARQEEAIALLRDVQATETRLREERIALSDQLARLDIAAPVSGAVYGLSVFAERSVLKPAQDVLYIVPQDRPLIIAAQIDPIHVDQVFVGQQANVRFPTFDQRTTPELFGTVSQVSADAFDDRATGQRFYRAEITLTDEEVSKLPSGATLIPGMPVDSFLRTQDRSPLNFLVKPLADYFTRAMRE